jgi:tetratricopeptide (TPR) repeat protein
MTHSGAILLLFLTCLLVNAAVGHSQVNRRLAIDNVKRGTTELDAGNLEAALGHFERAIELDRNYGAAYFSRGLVRKRQRDYDGAISDFTRSIGLKPDARGLPKSWRDVEPDCRTRGTRAD